MNGTMNGTMTDDRMNHKGGTTTDDRMNHKDITITDDRTNHTDGTMADVAFIRHTNHMGLECARLWYLEHSASRN